MPVKMLPFAFSHLFNCAYFAKISLMQTNIRKSQNNILASPVCEIKDNLCHVLKNFFNGILIHIKYNLLISNNLDQIWFWKKIWLLFYQGVPIYFCRICHCIWCTHFYPRRIIVSYVDIYIAKRAIACQFTLQSHYTLRLGEGYFSSMSVALSLCLSVCLLATLQKNGWTDFHEIFMVVGTW